MRYSLKNLLLAFSASCVLAVVGGSPLSAQTVFNLNFDDPNDPRLNQIVVLGSSELREDGGLGDSGYISITDAVGGASGAIIFPDFSDPPGTALESFKITAGLRVGGGTTDRPADGFSFNLIRPEDPLIYDEFNEESLVFDEDGVPLDAPTIGQYAGIGSENSLPEEGSRTGLSIGFDEWQSGGTGAGADDTTCGDWNLFDTDDPAEQNAETQTARDCVGISVRVDGLLVAQEPFPVLHGAVDDIQSLQTGEQNADPADLGFATLEIQLTPDLNNEANSFLFVSYKDRVVFDGPIEYRPSAGQLFFGGRTGGANANHHIDDISITTDFTRVLLGDFNDDGVINLDDYGLIVANMNTSDKEFKDGDMDFNGRINLGDFVAFRKEFAKSGVAGAATAAIPEPATGLLAGFGVLGMMLARRRRR